jgi:hypothetical protein
MSSCSWGCGNRGAGEQVVRSKYRLDGQVEALLKSDLKKCRSKKKEFLFQHNYF